MLRWNCCKYSIILFSPNYSIFSLRFIKGLQFDLGDASKWEFMLPSNDKPILDIQDLEVPDDDEVIFAYKELVRRFNVLINFNKKGNKEVEKHLDLPPSWVDMISITPKEFEKRCPEGKKVIFYKKCKVEKFAPYLLKDNLVLKISEYSDYESRLLFILLIQIA